MKRNALMIGGFVVASFLLVIAAIFWLAGGSLFTKQQKASVFYDGNVSGLSIGAPVTFRGVSVGQVTDIGIQMDPATLRTYVPVTLKLQTSAMHMTDTHGRFLDITALVQRGLRARLASQSIVTGQKAVELDFAPDTPAALHGGASDPEIPALADRFGPLIDQVAQLPLRDTVNDTRKAIQELQETLTAVREILGGAKDLLAGVSTELRATSEESRKTLAAAREAIHQVEGASTETLVSITKLADTSRETVLAVQPELRLTLVGARQASETAKLAMDRIADVAAPGAPLRSDLEAAVKDLSQAARGLRSLSEMLEEKPNAIIFGARRE